MFQCLGENLLNNAFQGYNACIFAYGQTGTACNDLLKMKVKIYYAIYNRVLEKSLYGPFMLKS